MPKLLSDKWQFVSYRDIRHYITVIVNGIVGKIWSQTRQFTCQIATFGWLSQTKLLFSCLFCRSQWAIVQPILHLGSEPCALAFRKLSCGNCGGLASVFQRHLSLKMRNKFRRTNRTVGKQCWIPIFQILLGFFQSACVQHSVEPLRNPCI